MKSQKIYKIPYKNKQITKNKGNTLHNKKDFLSETIQARRQWPVIFKESIKGQMMKTTIQYQWKTFFKQRRNKDSFSTSNSKGIL